MRGNLFAKKHDHKRSGSRCYIEKELAGQGLIITGQESTVGEIGDKLASLSQSAADDCGGGRSEDELEEPERIVLVVDVNQQELAGADEVTGVLSIRKRPADRPVGNARDA